MNNPFQIWNEFPCLGPCLQEVDSLAQREQDRRLVLIALTAIQNQTPLSEELHASESLRNSVTLVQKLYGDGMACANAAQQIRLRTIWTSILQAAQETQVPLTELIQMIPFLERERGEVEDQADLIRACVQVANELEGTNISWDMIKELCIVLEIKNVTEIDRIAIIKHCISIEKALGHESHFLANVIKLAPSLFKEKMTILNKTDLIALCASVAKELDAVGVDWVDVVRLACMGTMPVWEKESLIQTCAAAAKELVGTGVSLKEIKELALSVLTAEMEMWNRIELILDCAKVVKRLQGRQFSLMNLMKVTKMISIFSERLSRVDKLEITLQYVIAAQELETTNAALWSLPIWPEIREDKEKLFKYAQSLFTEKMDGADKVGVVLACIVFIQELGEEEIALVSQAVVHNDTYSSKLLFDILQGICKIRNPQARQDLCKCARWIVPLLIGKHFSRKEIESIINDIIKIRQDDRENVCRLASTKLAGDDYFSEKSIIRLFQQVAGLLKKEREDALSITILVPGDLEGTTLPHALQNVEEKTKALGVYSPFYSPDPTAMQALNQEVHEILQEIRQMAPPSKHPIPQEIIQKALEHLEHAREQGKPNPYPALSKILERAELIAKRSDALFLPGGEDIPISLYHREAPLLEDTDYRRSLLEIALIHESLKRGIPLMGVCRGFQMANVYFGAKLENISGQKDDQLLSIQIPEESGWLDKALMSSIMGICIHDQSVTRSNRATEYLEYPIVYGDITKAASPKHAGSAPMILLQFHPEMLTEKKIQAHASYEGNLIFWKVLRDSAKAYQNKKKMLLQSSFTQEDHKDV